MTTPIEKSLYIPGGLGDDGGMTKNTPLRPEPIMTTTTPTTLGGLVARIVNVDDADDILDPLNAAIVDGIRTANAVYKNQRAGLLGEAIITLGSSGHALNDERENYLIGIVVGVAAVSSPEANDVDIPTLGFGVRATMENLVACLDEHVCGHHGRLLLDG